LLLATLNIGVFENHTRKTCEWATCV